MGKWDLRRRHKLVFKYKDMSFRVFWIILCRCLVSLDHIAYILKNNKSSKNKRFVILVNVSSICVSIKVASIQLHLILYKSFFKPQSIKWLPRMSSLKRIGLWILKSSSSLKTRNLKKTIQFLKTRKSGESNLLEFRWMLTHEFCFCPCLLQKEQNLLLIHDIKLRSLMIWLSSGWRKLKYLQRRGLKIWLKKKWKQKTWERGKYSTSKLDLPDTNSSWDLLDLHCFTSYCIKDGVLDLFMDLRFTTRQSKL